MNQPSVSATKIKAYRSGKYEDLPDLLAVEEPLEIRIGYGKDSERRQERIAVTMRTPGNDFELAMGFLYTESILTDLSDIANIRYCINKDSGEEENNILRVELKEDVNFEWKNDRNFYTSSSCGVCGKASIESVETTGHCKRSIAGTPKIDEKLITGLADKLRKEQQVFKHTGGLHAVALFNDKGELLMMREDIGRHNAMDKLIGAGLSDSGINFEKSICLLSGRASFELIQKAIMAGIPIVAAIGAPSSLARDLAEEFGMTLIGFLKQERFNLYCDAERYKD